MKSELIYTTDISIKEHSNFIVYRDLEDGEVIALYFERYEYEEEPYILIYGVELFDMVSNSWLNMEDLEDINSFSGANYQMNKDMTAQESAQFSNDLCSYYGANNFDSQPLKLNNNEFNQYIEDLNL